MNHPGRKSGQHEHRRQQIFVRLLAVLLLFCCIIGFVLWERSQEKEKEAAERIALEMEDVQDDQETVYENGKEYVLRENMETLLLIGEDKFKNQEEDDSYVNSQQADFLMLLIMDKERNVCYALHLNRDTMTQIESYGIGGKSSGSFEGQLALAHTYGSGGQDSCYYQEKAVSNLLYGISIDHFCAVTMDAVALINDAVGGVSLEVADDMTSVDPAFVKGNVVTLQGDLALKYVRNRKELEDTTNLHRMERQRQYMKALYEKLMETIKNDDGFTAKLLLSVNDYVTSDCTVNQMQALADFLVNCSMPEIDTIPGENVKGEEFMEFYPDEEALRQYVLDHFYTQVNGTKD